MTWRPMRSPKRRVIRKSGVKPKVVWRARYGVTDDGKELFATREQSARVRENGSATFRRREQAIAAIDEAIRFEEERAKQPVVDRATVGEYFAGWLTAHPRSERSNVAYASRIEAALPVELGGLALRDWDLRDLRRRHGNEMVGHLLTHGRAQLGARGVLQALSAMSEDAITDELCDLNPWKGVKVRADDPRVTKSARPLRVWTWEEMHEFASFAGSHEAMVRVLADCGVRIGELLALRREGLRVADAMLEVRGTAWRAKVAPSSPGKNHDRDVPIPPGCLALLQAVPIHLHSPWLFPASDGGLSNHSAFVRNVWSPTITAANVDRVGRTLDPRPHEFRHSWVSQLRAVRIDPADLADVAGHTEETATRRYNHPLRRSFDAIRGAIG